MKCQAMPKGEEKKGQVSKRLNKQDIWSKNIPMIAWPNHYQ